MPLYRPYPALQGLTYPSSLIGNQRIYRLQSALADHQLYLLDGLYQKDRLYGALADLMGRSAFTVNQSFALHWQADQRPGEAHSTDAGRASSATLTA
jgi:hypothetical protein